MTLHIERPPTNGTRPATPVFRERRGMPAAPPIRLAHIVSVSGSHAVARLERQDAILSELFEGLLDRPDLLNPQYSADLAAAASDDARTRVVVDQVASLTDASALAWHRLLTA